MELAGTELIIFGGIVSLALAGTAHLMDIDPAGTLAMQVIFGFIGSVIVLILANVLLIGHRFLKKLLIFCVGLGLIAIASTAHLMDVEPDGVLAMQILFSAFGVIVMVYAVSTYFSYVPRFDELSFGRRGRGRRRR